MKRRCIALLLGSMAISLIGGCGDFSLISTLETSEKKHTNMIHDASEATSANASEDGIEGEMISITSFADEATSNYSSANKDSDPHKIAYHDDAQTESEPEPLSAQEKQELFQAYAPYGITYDTTKDQLFYNGKLVRWFEDYYPVEAEEYTKNNTENHMQNNMESNSAMAGIDFFCETGIVDVYATRDLTDLPQNPDGSYDPSGTLTGIQEFSQKDFAARDIDSIKNPPHTAATATEGGEFSTKEIQSIAEEYRPYGVTYDLKADQWYFNGEKVSHFLDILTSNGATLNSGNFHGSIRQFGNENGTVNIHTIRDFSHPNADGYGTLTGIEINTPTE